VAHCYSRSATDQISALATPQAEHVTIAAELEAAKRSIEDYQRVFGPLESAHNIKELGGRLEVADKEKQTLQLRLSESEAVRFDFRREQRADNSQATNALYSEVEGLSKLWEGLEQKVHSKVYDLKDGEMKMARLATEVCRN